APEAKHAAVAVPVLSTAQNWLKVLRTTFRLHHKQHDPTAPPCLCVSYRCGLSVYSEYISIERHGYARVYAERWWFAMGGEAPAPSTVVEALYRKGKIDRPFEITLYRNGEWWNVSDRRLCRADGTVVEVDRNYWPRTVLKAG